MRRGALATILLGLLSAAAPARAQIDGAEAEALADAEAEALPYPTARLGGELGFEGLGEDYFLTLGLAVSVDRENWGVGLQLPLRFRIWDRDPANDGDHGGVLRREDWDQVSDYFRVLRYVYVGQADKEGPYYARLGELTALTVGHGTIMHRYFNGIDVNKWRTGVNAVVNIDAYSGEVMVGDLFDPYLFGMRFAMRPLDVFLPEKNPWASKLVVGHSLFVDAKAPVALARDADGGLETNDEGVPVVRRHRALAVLGLLDIGYELVDTEMFKVTPYMDLNKVTHVQHGWGWHLGVLWGLDLPLAIDHLLAELRTEYRFVSGDYLGPYFNFVYEIERYQRLSGEGGGQPKLLSQCAGDPLCEAPVPSGRHGFFFEGRVGLPKWVFVGFEYLDYTGPQADGQFRASVDVPALEFVRLSAFYYRVNVEGPGDLFAVDDKSAIVAQAQIPLYWLFDLRLRWWRIWRSCGDGATVCSDGQEGFQSVDDWSVSVGFETTF